MKLGDLLRDLSNEDPETEVLVAIGKTQKVAYALAITRFREDEQGVPESLRGRRGATIGDNEYNNLMKESIRKRAN